MLKKLKKMFRNNERENIELIRKSNLFDEEYYKIENPKIKGDLCKHYYYYGWKEGKSPSFDFSNDFYLKNYKDVGDANINPLLHYLKFGKAESRIIEKDNGVTLKKIYEKIYGCPYFYKTYICSINVKRINLFFDSIDENLENVTGLIEYIISFCEEEKYELRIIYKKANFEKLKEILNAKNIKLPNQTTFLNLKSSNYLEVGLNEKYVCTTWQTARALLNTGSINTNIYYYLSKNIENLCKEEYYQISNICTNKNIIVIAENKKLISSIKNCELKFEVSQKKIKLKNINKMYCNFNKMFIVGVEILNDSFLSGTLKSDSWKINILEKTKDFKFHFDTNVSIKKVNNINSDADLIFNINYDKQNVIYDKPYINSWVEESEIDLNNYILINEEKDFGKLKNNEKNSISTINNYYDKFRKSIDDIKDER